MDKDVIQTGLIAAVALVLGLPTLRLVRQGRVSGLTAGRDGIKLEMTPLDQRDEARHYMDRRIDEVDADLRLEARDITQMLRKPILKAVSPAGLCTAALRAVAADLRGPIYRAVEENDFKHKLAAENRAAYLGGKLAALEDEYQGLVEEASGDPCIAGPTATIAFPSWSDIEPLMSQMLDAWAQAIASAVSRACERKINIYREYRPQFESARDTRFVGIVDGCIAKNEGYIKALGGTL